MKLTYKVRNWKTIGDKGIKINFPLGHIGHTGDGRPRLYLGSITTESFAHLSEAEVLAILSETISRTNGKIKVEFDDITLEFE